MLIGRRGARKLLPRNHFEMTELHLESFILYDVIHMTWRTTERYCSMNGNESATTKLESDVLHMFSNLKQE